MLVRLNKYLADRGVASRRKCDEYIAAGRIHINGKVVTELGTKVDTEKDEVRIDAIVAQDKQKLIYIALNKPVGYVCSVTGPEEPKVTELVAHIDARLFPVGRLDKLTSGLLLMTNDGRFAYELTHPKFEKEKEYVVKVREKVTPTIEAQLGKSFYINGKLTRPAEITLMGPHLFSVILREGRNRQIRRMCERSGLHIEKLKRIRIGPLMLGELAVGYTRTLSKSEVTALRDYFLSSAKNAS